MYSENKMTHFSNTKFNDIFFDPAFQDYCVILIEHRDRSGGVPDEKTLAQILTGCNAMLDASYVSHFVEEHDHLIFCYLNYDSRTFSIRALVGSLKQTIFNIVPEGNRTVVYYSDPLRDETSVVSESIFMARTTGYGTLLGSSAPLRTSYIHTCEESPAPLDRDFFTKLFSDLSDHELKKASDYLAEEAEFFRDAYRSNAYYTCSEMLHYISSAFFAMKHFFDSVNLNTAFYENDIQTLLYKHNGCSGLLLAFSEQLKEYDDASTHAVSPLKDRERTSEIINYVVDNLATTNLNETASYFGVTPEYLCRLFKQNTGMNYSKFIRDKRFEKALEFLGGNEKMSVAAISATLGYKSQSYFQNIFKKEFGITPEAYRRSIRMKQM